MAAMVTAMVTRAVGCAVGRGWERTHGRSPHAPHSAQKKSCTLRVGASAENSQNALP